MFCMVIFFVLSKSFDKRQQFLFLLKFVNNYVISYIFANNFRKYEAMDEENFRVKTSPERVNKFSLRGIAMDPCGSRTHLFAK